MAQQTKVNGAIYSITHGLTKLNGTIRTIEAGKTKIGGTIRDISFGPIPYSFQQVAYIQSKTNNGPYIVLPITTQEGLKFEFECEQYAITGITETCRLGYHASNSRDQYFTGYRNSTALNRYYGQINIGSSQVSLTTQSMSSGTGSGVHMIVCKVDFGNYGTANSASVQVGDEVGSTTRTSAISFGGSPMYLFAYSTGTQRAGTFGRITAYNASDAVIMDLYPVKRKSDSAPGFWDSVSRQFLINSGSGSFTVGPDV